MVCVRPGPSLTSSVSSVTDCARPVWFVTIRRIGPAPNDRGETCTPPSITAAVTLIGAGGRSRFVALAVVAARAEGQPERTEHQEPPPHGRTVPPLHAVRRQAYQSPVVLARPAASTQPLATAEFLAVDTETNGLARERCELTEIGAVLVGGGELHDRWASLVGVSAPLSRGIQRFTGITQAMVDAAPPPESVLPELARLLRGRVLIAHSARFDLGVLRGAFARAALDWPEPPVLCTVAMARRFAPLQRRRGLAALADALGIEVDVTHRALPDAETCARVFCALFGRLSAHAGTSPRPSRC